MGNYLVKEVSTAVEAKISTYDDGPFLVTGHVVIEDADGNEYPTEKETIALCRCGSSIEKPFCDGTHSKIGFRAAHRAINKGCS
jgi:CDGSH-type Zn-finger protein